MKLPLIQLAALTCASLVYAAPPEPKFRHVTIDPRIQIGYGVAVADVNGDKLPDILLADKKQFVWYRNPGPEKVAEEGAWQKFILAENLTEKDNVCIAAQDIDGDGKCEVAVGAEWNPGDTVNSGAVFYLIPPEDRMQPWTPLKLHAEPTTHRMRWMEAEQGNWGLVVLPLHGRGNKNGEGAGVHVLFYRPPAELNHPRGEWKTELLDESMHMTHNFDVGQSNKSALTSAALLCASKEGVALVRKVDTAWERKWLTVSENAYRRDLVPPVPTDLPPGTYDTSFEGAGEVRGARLPGGGFLFVTVEPMHGNSLVRYVRGPQESLLNTSIFSRRVVTDKLTEGHGLACGDLLGIDSDQVVVGWRGKPGEGENIGLAVWTPLDKAGDDWRETIIDPDSMACEDLQLADLNGDGKLDIVASGRATKNLKIYLNETAPAEP